jgi:2',3'-cyclic-nucleotide 2'-phosphodiesterase (5'-nucleotidase family)
VDAVVLVSNLGYSGDRKLLEQVSGVDVAIGGRSGERFQRPQRVRGVPVVQAGTRGKFLGRLELQLEGNGTIRVRNQILPLDSRIQEASDLVREIDAYLEGLPEQE